MPPRQHRARTSEAQAGPRGAHRAPPRRRVPEQQTRPRRVPDPEPIRPQPAGPPRRSTTRFGRLLRGLSGSLALGSLLLALALIGVQIWAVQHGYRGPGAASVVSQSLVALVALFAQSIADRRRDRVGALFAAGALALVLGSLWFWWW
ncbi:hypothetical protein [Saccharopolyspora sp. CA-218241]|uniref:hypothetical protein n=1 Tax=Saccharopolyspora sp. CA-218241 TaxID=3240027 RepID=UPI003D98E279